MGYIKLKADKSNTINSYSLSSNQGDNVAVEIFAKNNTRDSVFEREKSRALFRFDYTDFIEAYNDGIIPQDFSTVTATMTFYNMYDEITTPPTNVKYCIYSLSSDWHQGMGLDTEDLGYSNWYSPFKPNTPEYSETAYWWGASVTSREIAEFQTVNGTESITADAIPTLSGYFNTFGSFTAGENYGLCIQLDDLYESSTAYNYEKKILFSSKTNSIFYPVIDIVWNDKFQDDFKYLYFGSTGTIYFYNKKRGILNDLDGTNPFPGTFSITGTGTDYSVTGSASALTGIVISGVNGTRVDTGIYKFELPVLPYDYGNLSNFIALWTITSSLSAVSPKISKSVTIHSPIESESMGFNVKFRANVINFREKITIGEKFNWSIYFKKELDVITPLTAGSTAINSYIVTEGYWKIVDERTGVDVYPWQDISYNDTINFINFESKYLEPYRPYRLVLKIVEDERIYYIDTPEYYFVFNTY